MLKITTYSIDGADDPFNDYNCITSHKPSPFIIHKDTFPDKPKQRTPQREKRTPQRNVPLRRMSKGRKDVESTSNTSLCAMWF